MTIPGVLNAIMKAEGWTRAELSEKMGIPYSVLHVYLHDKRDPMWSKFVECLDRIGYGMVLITPTNKKIRFNKFSSAMQYIQQHSNLSDSVVGHRANFYSDYIHKLTQGTSSPRMSTANHIIEACGYKLAAAKKKRSKEK